MKRIALTCDGCGHSAEVFVMLPPPWLRVCPRCASNTDHIEGAATECWRSLVADVERTSTLVNNTWMGVLLEAGLALTSCSTASSRVIIAGLGSAIATLSIFACLEGRTWRRRLARQPEHSVVFARLLARRSWHAYAVMSLPAVAAIMIALWVLLGARLGARL